MKNIASFIDHTNLNAKASEAEIKKLCKEAILYGFASVCVNPVHVPLAVSILKDKNPKVCTVVGFPLGAISAEMKFAEARFLIHQGADELDMVLNIGALKEKKLDIIKKEIEMVVNAADGNCVKVIIETSLLDQEEKILACTMVETCGASFIKTSTGFSKGGATDEDVMFIRKTISSKIGIKASGGINTKESVLSLINAGANRIGTSNAISILK